MKPKLSLLSILMIIIGFFPSEKIWSQCTNCNATSASIQNSSSALGFRSKASGLTSFASGTNVIASGDYTISLGLNNQSSAENSLSLGNFLISSASGSMVIGGGFDMQYRLTNNKANSLMVGFRSKYPTLFIGTSPSVVGTGRVGIGNVINPQAKLHIRADEREQASLFLEQVDFTKANIFIGNMDHGIEANLEQGLIFHCSNNYLFKDGRVGIKTSSPTFDLEVQGKTFTRHFTLFDPELYQENINGWILRSDASGRAVWTDPALFNDADWIIKAGNVYRPEGNVGIGTTNPVAQLDLADVYPAGGMNIKVGNDSYLTDIDRGHTLGIFSQTDQEIGGLKLGGMGPTLFGREKRLGIGTKNPSTSLELSNSTANNNTVGMSITNPETISWFVGMDGSQQYKNDLLIGNMQELESGLSAFMVVKPDGNIGLGTNDTHGYKLAVNGAIITEEVTVKVNELWPDYVFKEEYNLMPLDLLESFIANNGHLPGVPPEEQVLVEGINIGDMESLLLRKVEELTLYLIRQQGVIEDLKRRIEKSSEKAL